MVGQSTGDQGPSELDAVQVELEVLERLGAHEDELRWLRERAGRFRDIEKVAWVDGVPADARPSIPGVRWE